MMRRRSFLASILAAGFAPAAIGSGILMPVRQLVTPWATFGAGRTITLPRSGNVGDVITFFNEGPGDLTITADGALIIPRAVEPLNIAHVVMFKPGQWHVYGKNLS